MLYRMSGLFAWLLTFVYIFSAYSDMHNDLRSIWNIWRSLQLLRFVPEICRFTKKTTKSKIMFLSLIKVVSDERKGQQIRNRISHFLSRKIKL